MLRERARILAGGLFILDLALLSLAFLLSFWLRSTMLPALGWIPTHLYPLRQYLPLLPLVLALWGGFLLRYNLYHSQRTTSLLEEALDIIRACVLSTLLLVLVIFTLRVDERLLGHDRISRLWILLLVVLACNLLLARMVVVRLSARWVRSRGYNYRTVLIAGVNDTAHRIARSIEQHSHWGLRILGFVSESSRRGDDGLDSYPYLGRLEEIPDIVNRHVVDEVLFALRRQELHRLEPLLLKLEEQGIRARLALDLFPHAKARVEIGTLDDMPLLTYSTTPISELQLFGKRTVDLLISATLLALGLPAMLAIAVAIKLAYGGKVLYRQTRCGLHGRRFTLLKFRTMVENAEQQLPHLEHLNEMDGPVFKIKEDPRITPFGRWLRRLSLDELPQLWNVLKGDMSMVGPRPPVPQEVSAYQRWQRRRLSMRPGLTCLWQIQGRNELDFDRWMELDLEYIDNWSPLLDLKIMFRTIPVVLSGRGAF